MALIGISGSIIKETKSPFEGYARAYVNEDYIKAIINANGTPIIIPITENEAVIADIVSRLDGLILSGGHDVVPQHYGENPRPKIGEVFPERDAFDLKLIEYAKTKQIPILGICRGFQILNVFHGGSLYQDLDYIENQDLIQHEQASGPCVKTHGVSLDETSLFASVVNKNRIDVNSFHHQALKAVGEGLVAVGLADDGVVEVIESKSYPWLIGVQFHPEMLHGTDETMQTIFNAFVSAADKE